MQTIQFIQYTPEQLQSEISNGVKIQLEEFLKHFTPTQPKEYLTRQEVATMLSVDLSTIHNMCKSKRLHPLSMGGSRVYFLRSTVEANLRPINV
jgi:predicted DNA-binding transcriptional regulator AlpA